MRVIYNGVDLAVVETVEYDWAPVFDDTGVDYLYSRVSVLVRAVVTGIWGTNGPFMAYSLSGTDKRVVQPGPQPGGAYVYNYPRLDNESPVIGTPYTPAPPGAGPGTPTGGAGAIPAAAGLSAAGIEPINSQFNAPDLRAVTPLFGQPAIATHRAVRFRLNDPRGKLYVFRGPGLLENYGPPKPEDVSLESPEPGRVVDCKNGPVPKVLGVYEALGDMNTLMVDFAVETYVNEAPVNNVSPNGVLLSHRFSQSHGLTKDHRTVITTTGLAIFRTDLIYQIPQSPDFLRPVLFFPIPQGFVRSIPQVRGREDVTGVEYEYQDEQVAVNFAAGPYSKAASISALHRQAILSDRSVLDGVLSAYERTYGLQANRNFARSEHPVEAKAGGSVPDAGRAGPSSRSGGGRYRPAPKRPKLLGKPKAPFYIPGKTP